MLTASLGLRAVDLSVQGSDTMVLLAQRWATAYMGSHPGLRIEVSGGGSGTGVAALVMTADCLPVLFCDRAGTRVAAAHAGWRGLAGGVLENTLKALAFDPVETLVWLGPAIGPAAFEVGAEVREAFVAEHAEAASAFVPGAQPGKFMANIYQLARIRLVAQGVTAIYGGGLCTVSDQRFFSYRRAARTGRFASLIWLAN